MESKRYMLIVIGSSNGLDEDLYTIADERGAHFVDGKGIFLATFYTELSILQIHDLLSNRPAFMIFDIDDTSGHSVALPTKYYKGLFPEIEGLIEEVTNVGITEKEVHKSKKPKKEENVVEEYTTIDDILDKLSRNNYDRKCLTPLEISILEKK